jgi:hypothetical protein
MVKPGRCGGCGDEGQRYEESVAEGGPEVKEPIGGDDEYEASEQGSEHYPQRLSAARVLTFCVSTVIHGHTSPRPYRSRQFALLLHTSVVNPVRRRGGAAGCWRPPNGADRPGPEQLQWSGQCVTAYHGESVRALGAVPQSVRFISGREPSPYPASRHAPSV